MGENNLIELNYEACDGCGQCLENCPENVFEPGQRLNAKGYCPPVVARPEACLGCGLCGIVCPVFGLEAHNALKEGKIVQKLQAKPSS
jgi:2-oxoglutarate ferredoxin oxidoreductase subunit delta